MKAESPFNGGHVRQPLKDAKAGGWFQEVKDIVWRNQVGTNLARC